MVFLLLCRFGGKYEKGGKGEKKEERGNGGKKRQGEEKRRKGKGDGGRRQIRTGHRERDGDWGMGGEG
jgi:hypothetical protein